MEQNEKKKKSIYSLFEKEQLVTFKDNNGNESDILFVKMTQGELTDALEIYNKRLSEERNKIRSSESNLNDIRSLVESFNKEEKVKVIMDMETAYRDQIIDLYPIEDEENKTEEQKNLELIKITDDWKKKRTQELSDMKEEELINIIIDLRVESLAMVRASIEINNFCISCMARDPETKIKIFDTSADVFRVKDKSIINKMIEIVQEFRTNTGDGAVRGAAQSGNFTQPGQSQES